MYLLYKSDAQSAEAFSAALRGPVAEQLLAQPGVRKMRVSVADADVAPAAKLRQGNSRPMLDALVSLWVDSSVYRAPLEAILTDACPRFHGYLVTESEPLVNTAHPARDGERVYGMNQVVCLQKPPRLSTEDWIKVWHGSHTQLALETQSTFCYRQNVVARALTYGAPACDAIIEENFPPEAMTSQHVFYDAVGDDARLQRNQKAMMESCARFIDFDKIDVLPTSEYVLRN